MTPRSQRLASRLPKPVLAMLRDWHPHSALWHQASYLKFYRRDYRSKPGRWRT